MLNKKPLVVAIATAIGVASASGALTNVAYGSDENLIEEITVTGSRIKTSVSDAPRPVTIITRADIDLSGLENVADVLRNTTYNTFGSFRERSGTSFGQIALVNLRGLGSDYTAVLINGRRVPGNPMTGSSAVDLNSIPLSAVERIELLTDSASAIYGADAIGGVINIIFRDDYDGLEVEIGGDRPSEETGADTDHFNMTIGASNDKTSVMFSAEWFKRSPIFDKNRDYSKASWVPGPDGTRPRLSTDTVGISGGGNTGFEQNFSAAFQMGDCPESTYVKIRDPFGVPGDGCGFAYANRSMQTGGVERVSTFLNARYEVTDNLAVYYESRLTRAETFGRYAPAVGFFTVGADAPTNPFIDTDNPRDISVFHRFVGHGNRDESHNITEIDNVVGISGTLPNTEISYDAYVRYYEYNNRNEGDTYVLTNVLEELALSGAYDVNNALSQDPTHLAAVQLSSATLLRDISTDYTSAAVVFDGAMFELPAGSIGWALGAEISSEHYEDQYDSAREAGNILGSAGNSAAGNRSKVAFFGELQIPILDDLEVNLAVRYDDYDDFGEETSPQISVRYQPIDQVTFRLSWGEGFKAPNISQLHGELAQSFNNGRDYVRCDAQIAAGVLTEADGCASFQYENLAGGNPELSAESSESFNIGVIIEPFDNFRLSVDFYEIELTDKVTALSVQNAIDFQREGIALPSGVEIVRGAATTVNGVNIPGVIDYILKPYANLSEQKVEGFDVRAHYDYSTDGWGSFSFNLDYSEITEYSEITLAGQDRAELAGTVGAPDQRAALTVRWKMDNYVVNLTSAYIGDHGDGEYDSYNRHDISLLWATPWDGDLSVGIRNFLDEGPVLGENEGWNDSVGLYLYDVAGRTPYLSYSYRF